MAGSKFFSFVKEMLHVCLLLRGRRFSFSFLRIFSSEVVQKTMIGASQFSTFIFLDLETTGLQKPAEITELTMIAVERDHIVESSQTKTTPRLLDKFTTCVRPTKEIEWFASTVTCLSNEDLEKRKGFDIELGKIVRSFITRQPQPVCLIAHNGDNFDFKILASQMKAVGITLPESVRASDSLKAFRKQHKEAKTDLNNGANGTSSTTVAGKRKRFSCSLNNLYCSFVGGEFENAHSSEGDALALLRLVIHKPDILEYLENGAHELSWQNKENGGSSVKKPKVALNEKDINQVQDEYLSQLEKEGLL